MKKKIVIVLMVITTFILLSACGSQKKIQATVAVETNPETSETIGSKEDFDQNTDFVAIEEQNGAEQEYFSDSTIFESAVDEYSISITPKDFISHFNAFINKCKESLPNVFSGIEEIDINGFVKQNDSWVLRNLDCDPGYVIFFTTADCDDFTSQIVSVECNMFAPSNADLLDYFLTAWPMMFVQSVDASISGDDAGSLVLEMLDKSNEYTEDYKTFYIYEKNGVRWSIRMQGMLYMEAEILPKESGSDSEGEPEPAIQTSEPTEEATEKPAPESEGLNIPSTIPTSLVYEGNGDSVIEIDHPEGIYVFYIKGNVESRHFSVKGYDSSGDSTELFVNTSDYYEGVTIDPNQETEMLEISSTGAWTVEVRSIWTCDIINDYSLYNGTGDSIILLNINPSIATIEGNAGSHHFAMKSYGDKYNLMVNTTDVYSGAVMMKGNPVLIEVNAIGSWSILFK